MASVQNQPEAIASCPRCGKKLTEAAGLGWCSACGYCRALEESAKVEETPMDAAATAPEAAARRLPAIPEWIGPLIVGVILVVATAYTAGGRLAPASLGRALWTTLQIGVGLFVLFIGQFIAVLRIAPEDAKLGFQDVLMPIRLYGLVFARLPAMRLTVWTLSWGLALIFSALIFIGGMDHWFTYLKKPGDQKGQSTLKK